MGKYTTTVVAGNECGLMRKNSVGDNNANVMHLEQDGEFMHQGYTPARPRTFKAGWYFDSGEDFDGPFATEEEATSKAMAALQEWDEYITSASTGWGQPIDY